VKHCVAVVDDGQDQAARLHMLTSVLTLSTKDVWCDGWPMYRVGKIKRRHFSLFASNNWMRL